MTNLFTALLTNALFTVSNIPNYHLFSQPEQETYLAITNCEVLVVGTMFIPKLTDKQWEMVKQHHSTTNITVEFMRPKKKESK